MKNNSIKISSIVSQQLPEFVRIEFPLVEEFLKSYYDSLESSFAPYDIVKNLTNYIKIDDISHLTDDFILNTSISSSDDEFVIYSKTNNLKGLPRELGFLQINDEIILYKELTRFDDDGSDLKVTVNNKEYFAVKLIGCSRGFSAVVDLTLEGTEDQLLFQESSASPHNQGDSVSNLSIIFFIEFLRKIKKQFLPGFEDRKLNNNLNQNIFIKQSKDFYSSKGSDTSFKILFRALYDKDVTVIKPSDNVIEPSIANYRVVRNALIERIQGDPLQLLNRTLYQDASPNIPAARGTISKVEKTFKNNREYFLISIDDGYERDINYRGTIFSSFTVHPKTTVTTSIISGDTFIDVDSTVSFPESGTLVFFTSVEGSSSFVETRITYESKSLTQFFGCKSQGSQDIQVEFDSGKEIYLDVYAYGILDPKTNEQVKIRITGVLDEFEIPEKNYLYKKNDPIKIKNLGINSSNKRDNNWIFNIPVFYNIIDAELENQVTNEYTIFFADSHNFSKSDTFIVNEIPGLFASIISISSKKSLAVRFFRTDGLPIALTIQQIKVLSITKEIIKAKIKNYPNLNVFSSNVQNTYIDDSGNLYVASQSIPGYSDLTSGGNIEIDVKDG
jgi:hypothetical protein